MFFLRYSFLKDTKPLDYNYITTNIISAASDSGKVRLLRDLEQILLKGITIPPPQEKPVDFEFTRVFSGSDSKKILCVWYLEVVGSPKMHRRFLKERKLRLN